MNLPSTSAEAIFTVDLPLESMRGTDLKFCTAIAFSTKLSSVLPTYRAFSRNRASTLAASEGLIFPFSSSSKRTSTGLPPAPLGTVALTTLDPERDMAAGTFSSENCRPYVPYNCCSSCNALVTSPSGIVTGGRSDVMRRASSCLWLSWAAAMLASRVLITVLAESRLATSAGLSYPV